MKTFWAFLKKEFRHILRDRRTLLILFGLPIVQILLFGFALSNEVKNAPIVIVDEAKDAASQTLITQIDASKYFTIVGFLNKSSEIEPVFRKGQAKMAVVIPPNFAADLAHLHRAQVQLIADASDTNTATTLVNYASAIVLDFQKSMLNGAEMPYTIEIETRMLFNPQLNSAYGFVPGVITLVIMLLGAMMTSAAIVREKEFGNMEVLLVSPLKPFLVIVTKAIPYLLLSFLDVVIILILGVLVLKVPIEGSLGLLLAECSLFIFTSLCIGLFISTAVHTQQEAFFISSVGLMMPTIVFSGFLFPLENMPLILQGISHVVPARWFYIIVQSVMIKGLGFEDIWKESLVLALMAIVLLALSIKKFKIRLA